MNTLSLAREESTSSASNTDINEAFAFSGHVMNARFLPHNEHESHENWITLQAFMKPRNRVESNDICLTVFVVWKLQISSKCWKWQQINYSAHKQQSMISRNFSLKISPILTFIKVTEKLKSENQGTKTLFWI